MRLEELKPGLRVAGLVPDGPVTVERVTPYGPDVVEVLYRDEHNRLSECLLYRSDEERLQIVAQPDRPLSLDADGELFRLVAEAQRIRLAYLFDPLLAVHTSLVEPLPHQITAVYEHMLPRQPLRFLLADDPGAGKTIMAGLFIKELIARGDLERCLIVCPGNLVEQWQDELYQKFHLPFEILTNEGLESARTGNWFLEHPLAIARLDKLARDESLHDKLRVPECFYDLIVVDEAHKMSATYFGSEIKYTKRYRLGQLLSGITRHFLLMTATPHNGKEEDFQLFLALLDPDRFEGRFREGVHHVDISDLMRRMVKEKLVKMDGTPLFPERRAQTVGFELSPLERHLYDAVTAYVREEFNRAEALQDNRRAGTVGFALTMLQRRLASSPEAIYHSLRRRREKLQHRLEELERRRQTMLVTSDVLDPDELEDIEDWTEEDLERAEEEIFDQATAARTIDELRAEIETLKDLERLAAEVRKQETDTKWRELRSLLELIYTPDGQRTDGLALPPDVRINPNEKLIIFTEHRDTLNYLAHRIRSWFGRSEAVEVIHGGMRREDRHRAQERFLYDPEVRILVATDAAGEGVNLQRAHLMINYDLPWNPNRIEQRFGRIHRIGQTEVCFLWNLVALNTREGDVYYRLLQKLETIRERLGDQVFDVLGRLTFDGRSLRDLLIEAIRYGEQPEARERLHRVIEEGVDPERLLSLLEEKGLVHEVLDPVRLRSLREEMQRAEARKLQPHHIQAFFAEAFRRLGGQMHPREQGRFEITYVPDRIRRRGQQVGGREVILRRYERVTFEKDRVAIPGKPTAAFLCPGHPLLEAVVDLTLEEHRSLLRRGAILVDENDPGTEVRLLFLVEHEIEDGVPLPRGGFQVCSRRLLYIEQDGHGRMRHMQYAPYLDYRPLRPDDPTPDQILDHPACAWIAREEAQTLERRIVMYAGQHIVPAHLKEVSNFRREHVKKVRQAVRERLVKEIAYWNRRAEELRLREQAGQPAARMNSQEAYRRAQELEERLRRRMEQLDREEQLRPRPPRLVGGALIVPAGLLRLIRGETMPEPAEEVDRQAVAARAREIVMEVERRLGYEPVDREHEHLGYDIESRDPRTGRLRFIEVKGRVSGAETITVTRNEILTALNKPDDYILAIVEFLEGGGHRVHYVRRPFQREPDFGVTSVNYRVQDLIDKAELMP